MALALPLRIGTRGSPLALAQAETTRARLAAVRPELAAQGAIEIVAIRTSGDRITDRPLAEVGGKGLFTKEIEEALREARVRLAVHSAKDMETSLPAGLAIGAALTREDPRDALLAAGGGLFQDLPRGARIGTSSLRRAAQLRARRPDLAIVPLRGNVDTRIRKLANGEADATILALAGLKRLGLAGRASEILGLDLMLPAPGQGTIALECNADDTEMLELLRLVGDAASLRALECERALLASLDGSCRTPIAALAAIAGNEVALDGLYATLDGQSIWRTARRGPAADAVRLGADAGAELRRRSGMRQ
jgi:hydroxymethylbilane synthase